MAHKRRLAAIMFTDIQGYTHIMQESEEKAVRIRERHREIFVPYTLKYDGSIIQYYGDGTLSIFDSCVDAVRCACALQLAFLESPGIPVRIGIHVGDIILDKEDIIGDSVNLASRIESLGVAGSVLISGKVYTEIRNKEKLPVKNLGKFHFKNDAVKREVYAMALPGLVVPQPGELQGKLEKTAHKRVFKKYLPYFLTLLGLILISLAGLQVLRSSSMKVNRLAVLPLENRIDKQEQEYLVDGMHEELILSLSEAGIKVRSYPTMKQYKGTQKTIREIARELDVDALVSGSVHRTRDGIMIRVQLINGRQDEYLMEPFERQANLANIPLLYVDLVRSLASAIEFALTPATEALLLNIQAVDPKAYDLYLKGRYQLNLGTQKSSQLAINHFKESVAIAPDFGSAYSGLVESYLLSGFVNINSSEAHQQFQFYVQKAIELDHRFGQDHHLMAMTKVFGEWDWSGAEEQLKLAIAEDPESSETYDSYCQLMWAMGRMEKSIETGEKAVELDPQAHFARCDLAWAYFFADRYEDAHNQLDILYNQDRHACPYHASLYYTLELNDPKVNFDTLLAELEERERLYPDDSEFATGLRGYVYALQGRKSEALDIAVQLHHRSLFEGIAIYLALNEKEKALELLEQAYQQRSYFLLYTIKIAPWFDPLRDDPRFQDLVERMGLAHTEELPLKR